jgi:hypothetical protein
MTVVGRKNYRDVDRAQPGYLNSRSSGIYTIKQCTSKQMQRQTGGISDRQEVKQTGHRAAWCYAGRTNKGENSWQAGSTGRQDSRQAGHTERQDYIDRSDGEGGRTPGRRDL